MSMDLSIWRKQAWGNCGYHLSGSACLVVFCFVVLELCLACSLRTHQYEQLALPPISQVTNPDFPEALLHILVK